MTLMITKQDLKGMRQVEQILKASGFIFSPDVPRKIYLLARRLSLVMQVDIFDVAHSVIQLYVREYTAQWEKELLYGTSDSVPVGVLNAIASGIDRGRQFSGGR
jgi:hypothetical protein